MCIYATNPNLTLRLYVAYTLLYVYINVYTCT